MTAEEESRISSNSPTPLENSLEQTVQPSEEPSEEQSEGGSEELGEPLDEEPATEVSEEQGKLLSPRTSRTLQPCPNAVASGRLFFGCMQLCDEAGNRNGQ